MKSLRSSGVSTAARTARRSSRLPPNRRSSVSTLIAAAPPAAYAVASAAGSGMSARSPLLGLRRLTSAITLIAAVRKAGIGSRAGGYVGQGGPQVGLRHRRLPAGEILADADDDLGEDGHAGKPLIPGQRGRGEPATSVASY